MKCKYCGAKGIKISHFMKKHKALMLRKSAAGRRKGGRSKGRSSGGSGRRVSGRVIGGRVDLILAA